MADTLNWQALHRVAEAGDALAAEQLIQAGAQVDAADAKGFTALHLAAKKGTLQ